METRYVDKEGIEAPLEPGGSVQGGIFPKQCANRGSRHIGRSFDLGSADRLPVPTDGIRPLGSVRIVPEDRVIIRCVGRIDELEDGRIGVSAAEIER